jgi:GNAT superfamily N-acetyltransferase
MGSSLHAGFRVRSATPSDAPVIAWHRARMFQDMGQLPPALFEALKGRAQAYLFEALARGEYVGWLASPEREPETIVAGAGVQLRRVLPHPLQLGDGGIAVGEGRHGIVLNLFTEPAWRRRGLGELLMRKILAWAQEERLERLVLHASDDGRRLYERLGFVATNEMRLPDATLLAAESTREPASGGRDHTS